MSSILLLGFLYTAVAQKCYYRDGSDSGQKPCPSQNGQTESACCGTQTDGTDAWCLTNGLCLSDFKVWRGSCTDKTWSSEACPSSYCAGDGDNGPFQLSPCFNDVNGLKFGCYDCKANNFSVPPGRFLLSNGQKQAFGLVATSTITFTSTLTPTNLASDSSPATSTSSVNPLNFDQNKIIGLAAALAVVSGVSLVAILALSFQLYKARKNKTTEGREISAAPDVAKADWYPAHAPHEAPYSQMSESLSAVHPSIIGQQRFVGDQRNQLSYKSELPGAEYGQEMRELDGLNDRDFHPSKRA